MIDADHDGEVERTVYGIVQPQRPLMTDSADAGNAPVTPPDAPGSTVTPPVVLAEALKRLARGSPTDLAALLHDVETHAVVDGTQVTAHCHCLKLDGNGRPRIDDLVKVVAEQVLDYTIPRSEIREALEEVQRSKSTQRFVRLTNDAKKLF